MRFVLDTDVMVAAFRSDQGASRQLLLAALDNRLSMLVSVPLMLEYEAVLKRPQHSESIGLELVEIDEILDAIATVIEPVRLKFLWRPIVQDPSDEMVLETAVNANADALVTFNVRHLGPPARQFGLRVAGPGQVWQELRRKHA